MSLPRDRFTTRLAASPLLADGGMGTLLFSRGIPQRACLDALASERPDLVGTLHREYLDAGADHVCLQVLGDDPFTVPVDDWARLAPAVAAARPRGL